MRLHTGTLLLGAMLTIAGLGAWTVGRWEERSAKTYEQLLTLAYDEPLEQLAGLERDMRFLRRFPFISGLDRSVREQRVTSQYWSGQYDGLLGEPSAPDKSNFPENQLLLHAANAAYRRAAVADNTPGAVEIVEGLLARYAELLRRGDWHFDSAYNYEFVARRRDALVRARSRRPDQKAGAGAARQPPGTIHGAPGAVPPGVDMSEFKMVVPQRSDERRQQPEGGRGGPKPRRG